MRWLLPKSASDTPLSETADQLAVELGIHRVAARVLVQRGYDDADKVRHFLSDELSALPDPSLMKGLDPAVERLCRAVVNREQITLWGDYDVDGVSSTSLLSTFLRTVGANVATYIPHRLGEGYGLNVKSIERIAGDGTRLLVTLDCGITSHAEIARANALGLECIVVDHHAVPETMPPALAVLNPLQPGCEYPTKYLCAAGVAFNLAIGIRRALRKNGWFNETRPEPNLKEYLDLVALATVADVVPLLGVNRLFVRHGLKELSKGRRPGVKALKFVCGLTGHDVTSGDVGFRLGPRINAAGRLDDAALGLKCLTAKTYEEALPLARALDAANAERQAIEKQILEQALEQAEARIAYGAKGLVLHAEGWHPGVVGIVASRVVDRFHRPTVVVGVWEGLGRGSARSIERFHLYDSLKLCSGHLTKFGGHKHAAGLSIMPDRLPGFVAAFEQIAAERLTDEDLVPRCKVDAVVAPGELDLEAVEALKVLAPFGAANPEPVLATCGVVAAPKVVQAKKEGMEGHLKLQLEANPSLDVIGFQLASRIGLTEGPIDLAFKAGIDEWNGNKRVSLKLKDLRSAA
ncbi:MAG: single-stranded-DNA-specific exonuclease RecJ [Myxococcaceae bacterium]|nr:single-stranded-DNA-specific exonuclease RecJ [Myxococcaceae bacterium]